MHQGRIESTLPTAMGNEDRRGGEPGLHHGPELVRVAEKLEKDLARAGSLSKVISQTAHFDAPPEAGARIFTWGGVLLGGYLGTLFLKAYCMKS